MIATLTQRKPHWHRLEKHAYVRAIGSALGSLGFEFERNDPHFLTWAKPAFSQTHLYIRLIEQRIGVSKGNIQFGVQLGVASAYLTEVANEVKTLECGFGMASAEDFPYRYPIDAVTISLHWLLLNADPPEQGRVSWLGSVETADASALQLADDIEKYGFPFFRQVDSPEKLIDLLKNIESYPRRLREPGPRSPDSGGYAALLLHQLGRSQEALGELEISRRQRLADYARSFELPPDLRELNSRNYSCRVDRFRQYVLANMGMK